MVENKYWYRGKFKKIVLTEYGKQYLIKHFPNTKNDILMEKMGLNFSSFHRIARSLGLVKTKQKPRRKVYETIRFPFPHYRSPADAEAPGGQE